MLFFGIFVHSYFDPIEGCRPVLGCVLLQHVNELLLLVSQMILRERAVGPV